MGRGRRIPIPLPNTGGLLVRKRRSTCLRSVIVIFLLGCAALQVYILTVEQPQKESHLKDGLGLSTMPVNDSVAAILQNVPLNLHKYLAAKPKNVTTTEPQNGTQPIVTIPSIEDIKRQISRYNEQQSVLNEDTFGPLQNDSVIVVVQVHKRVSYLRHLIVSLAQARDISKIMLIFSHDFYHEEINELVQSVDFCKVMQIYYPFSIQTHPNEFPGEDPGDCDRNLKKEQAEIRRCNNYQWPDLYGHYREAKFTQTKHHWWWKANRVFDELEVTRYHTGPVIFLEEDHYVSEDFLYLLALMRAKAHQVCPKCNILSLGTYLKTFNYYAYNVNKNVLPKPKEATNSNSSNNKKTTKSQSMDYNSDRKEALNSFQRPGGETSVPDVVASWNRKAAGAVANLAMGKVGNDIGGNYLKNNEYGRNILRDGTAAADSTKTENYPMQWGYQILPTLYSIYQKVEVTPWISSKHNMGMVFNKTTWREITSCGKHFCFYDDYNWDWSLQHLSQQCLHHKLYAMVLKGPRVFHIGECGVHHKKKNCESNQVISKVQKVLQVVTRSGQLYPKSIKVVMASVQNKNSKLRKGNGGWGDQRDHTHCMNIMNTTATSRY